MCTFFNRDKLATTHKRLLRLRNDHGWAGYGIYYRILELMVYDDDHYLDNDTALLAMALGLRTAKERAMLEDILYKYELFAFTEDETEFYSPSLLHKEEVQNEAPEQTEEAQAPKSKVERSPEAKERLRLGAAKARAIKAQIRNQSEPPIRGQSEKQSEIKTDCNQSQSEPPIRGQSEPNQKSNQKTPDLRGDIGGSVLGDNNFRDNNLQEETPPLAPPLLGEPSGGDSSSDTEGEASTGRAYWFKSENLAIPIDEVMLANDNPEAPLHTQLGIRLSDYREAGGVRCPYELVAFYNEHCASSGLIPARFSGQIFTHYSASLKRFGSEEALRAYLRSVCEMPFLCGEGANAWRADLLWLLKRENQDKVLAGNYAKRSDIKPTTAKAPTHTVPHNQGLSNGDTRWKNRYKRATN